MRPRLRAALTTLNPDLPADALDISHVMTQVEDLLDRSIAGFALQEKSEEPFNLSQIDFEALRRKRGEPQHIRPLITSFVAGV